MAELTATVNTSAGTFEALPVHPGELTLLPISWLNQDGSPRDMSTAMVAVEVRRGSDIIFTDILADIYFLLFPDTATAVWEVGSYEVTLTVSYLNRESDTTSFMMSVGGELLQAVNVTVEDDGPQPAPIVGVTVRVVDPSDSSFVSYGVTDADGHCHLLLPGDVDPGTDYELRFYKQGVQFEGPYLLSVFDPVPTGQTNDFAVTGTIVTEFGTPSDPLLCRCVGRFVDFQNLPRANTMVRIYGPSDPGLKVPKVVSGNMVSADSMEFRTDKNGYAIVDLTRGAEFRIVFAGEDDVTWNFKVPDRPSANLVELIHPQPLELVWDETVAPNNAVSIPVGSSLLVPVSVLFSDYQSRDEGLSQFLVFTITDSTIVDGTYLGGSGVDLTGKAPGTTTVVATLTTETLYPARVPAYSPTLPPLTVTVTT